MAPSSRVQEVVSVRDGIGSVKEVESCKIVLSRVKCTRVRKRLQLSSNIREGTSYESVNKQAEDRRLWGLKSFRDGSQSPAIQVTIRRGTSYLLVQILLLDDVSLSYNTLCHKQKETDNRFSNNWSYSVKQVRMAKNRMVTKEGLIKLST